MKYRYGIKVDYAPTLGASDEPIHYYADSGTGLHSTTPKPTRGEAEQDAKNWINDRKSAQAGR